MDLTVVVVSYNSAAWLPACLEAVARGARRVTYEVVLIDNASRDDSAAVAQRHDGVQVLVNDANLGFARAANRGFAAATGRHLLLLNPDTEVADESLDRAVAYLDAHPDVGILGARVNNPDGSLQRAARRSIPTPRVAFLRLSGLGRLLPGVRGAGAYNLDGADPDRELEVDAVSGSFLMVRREAMEAVGGMDERYFLYGEDLDFCLSIKQAGWRVVYYPEAVVVHHKGASSRQARLLANREFHRAMRLFHDKHFAAHTPLWLNLLIRAGIGARGTALDWALRLGLVRHVGSRG